MRRSPCVWRSGTFCPQYAKRPRRRSSSPTARAAGIKLPITQAGRPCTCRAFSKPLWQTESDLSLGEDAVTYRPGRHFLQIPGPTNVPDRILRAMDRPVIDHRGPDFARLGEDVLNGCRAIFQTSEPVVVFPASGTGAWEAC